MKKVSKTVTFTSETEEQNLLKKVEQELAHRKYNSFSILCKKALQAFLSQPKSPSNTNAQLEQSLAQLQLQLNEIKQALESPDEQKLGNQLMQITQQVEQVDAKTDRTMRELQQQMTELKQVLSKTDNAQQESQINSWLDRSEQVNNNFDRQLQQLQQQITHLTQTVSNWETKQLSPVKQPSESVNTKIDRNEELTELEASTVTPAQSEELLMHLKPLLDDF